MSKRNHIGERDWGKRPLFGSRRRRYAHWFWLLLLILIGAVLFLFPELVTALLTQLRN